MALFRRALPKLVNPNGIARSISHRVAVIGSGNWGTTAARIVAQNCQQYDDFDKIVKMWVFEEDVFPTPNEVQAAFKMHTRQSHGNVNHHEHGTLNSAGVQAACAEVGVAITKAESLEAIEMFDVDKDNEINLPEFMTWWDRMGHGKTGRKLSRIINQKHENVKYLPKIRLPENLLAVPSLEEATDGADLLIFVTPHQFIKGLAPKVKKSMRSDAKAISLIKGMDVTESGFEFISGLIHHQLGIDCATLIGANLANEIAQEQFSEATVGYTQGKEENGLLWKRLFHRHYFHVQAVPDVVGCELCGTLKNIVALGAGFVDGLGYGNNTKAAIIRIGLLEMRKLAQYFFPTVQTETFFESAGVADLITTCYGGRNRKCAEAYVKHVLNGDHKTFDQLEEMLLGGQKLQGVLTSHEVQSVLRKNGVEDKFPLFTTINRICKNELPPQAIIAYDELLKKNPKK